MKNPDKNCHATQCSTCEDTDADKTHSTALPTAVNLHAKFTPQGLEKEDIIAFLKFWNEFQLFIFKRFTQKHDSTAADERHIPDDVRCGNERIAELAKNPDNEFALEALHDGLEALKDLKSLAEKGNSEAMNFLVWLADDAAWELHMVQKSQPELFRATVRKKVRWSVLRFMDDHGALGEMAGPVVRSELGAECGWNHSKLRKAGGPPARRWAIAAVRTLEETRRRGLLWWPSKERLSEFVNANPAWNGIIERLPSWAAKAYSLPPFSRDRVSLDSWKALARAMIRDQMRDFDKLDDWKDKRTSCETHLRPKPGDVQNAILDAITDAMETIAPPCVNMPEKTAGIPAE